MPKRPYDWIVEWGDWQEWYAWHRVTTIHGEKVWLTKIYRRWEIFADPRHPHVQYATILDVLKDTE